MPWHEIEGHYSPLLSFNDVDMDTIPCSKKVLDKINNLLFQKMIDLDFKTGGIFNDVRFLENPKQ